MGRGPRRVPVIHLPIEHTPLYWLMAFAIPSLSPTPLHLPLPPSFLRPKGYTRTVLNDSAGGIHPTEG